MKLKYLFAVMTIIAFGSAFLIAGCSGATERGDGYEITATIGDDGNGQASVTGTVKNTCGRTETLCIAWNVLDKSGATIGTAVTSVENVPDGESKEFGAVMVPYVVEDDVDAALTLFRIGNYLDSPSIYADADKFGELHENAASLQFRDVVFMKEYNEQLEQQLDNLKAQQ